MGCCRQTLILLRGQELVEKLTRDALSLGVLRLCLHVGELLLQRGRQVSLGRLAVALVRIMPISSRATIVVSSV